MSKRFAVVFAAVVAMLGGVVLAPPAHATFPGGNGLLAFDSNRSGNFEIFTMNLDGTGLQNLTNDPSRVDTNPNWDPGGQKIVFMTSVGMTFDISVVNADGTGLTRLTDDPAVDIFPAFCDPDTILFGSNRDGDFDLWEIGVDGTGLKKVVDLPGTQAPGACRPDGKKITFTTDQDGNFEVYEMDRDGTDPVNLTNHPAADADPDYSPSGDQVLFDSDRDGNANVYLLDLPGGGPAVKVTPPPFDAPPFNSFVPRFTPEGDAYVVTVDDGVQADVYMFPLPVAPAGGAASAVLPRIGNNDGVQNLTDTPNGDSNGAIQPSIGCHTVNNNGGGNGDAHPLHVRGTDGHDRISVQATDGQESRVQVFDVGEPSQPEGALICDVPGSLRSQLTHCGATTM